jgi:hypothetical protein
VWSVVGLHTLALAWWLVAWVAATCGGLCYYVGHIERDRDATQRIERDERERNAARERVAPEQAEQVIKARRN